MGPLPAIWRFFGCDEPNYATMKDGQSLLAELGALRPNSVYFRTHNLLTTGDATPALKWGSTNAYTEDMSGRPVYDWKTTDSIFDSYRERGVRPYVEIGFMPEALSSRPRPYRHEWRPGLPYERIFTGWRMPPRSYARWGELVHQWARHCVQRYGAAEVRQWYWQTWNEANMCPDGYWGGTPEEFFALHDYAMDAVRRALPDARVGGPETAGHGGDFSRSFFEHCLHGTNAATGKKGAPLDFISFHAKGAPVFAEEHVSLDLAEQLRTVDRGFELVSSFPELRGMPLIIGECDPDGCAACRGPQLGYRNGTMYPSYTAASFTRLLDVARQRSVRLEGALTWAFEFEDQPLFAGYRVLTTGGIALPVLSVFRMFAMMGGERLSTESSGEVPLRVILESALGAATDVSALASVDAERLSILVWHYAADDVPGPDADVELRVSGLPQRLSTGRVNHYRIDADHSNAFSEWKRMGAPELPNEEQYDQLRAAGALEELAGAPFAIRREGGAGILRFSLPRHAVSLITLAASASDDPVARHRRIPL